MKYVLRAKHKEDEIEDLKKARWYLDYWITLLEGEMLGASPYEAPNKLA